MDPDAALDELLALVDRVQNFANMHLPPRVITQDTRRILELINALDGWLSCGGFVPDRWRPAIRSAHQ